MCLWICSPSWAQSDEVLVVWANGQPERADVGRLKKELASEGMRLFRVQTPSELSLQLQFLPIRRGRIAKACLERVALDVWRSDLDRAEVAVQVFQSEKALSILRDLDDKLVCLEAVPAPRELRRLSLTRVIALSLSGARDSELQEAIGNMEAMVSDFLEPVGLSQDLRSRFSATRRTENIRVFGGGTGGELFVDGETLASGAFLRGRGMHLVQLRNPRTERVSSGQVVFLDGNTIVIWAGDLGASPIQDAVDDVIHSQRRSELLRTISIVQRRTILLARRQSEELEIYHVDGRRWSGQNPVRRPIDTPVRVERDPRSVERRWSPPDWSVGVGLEWLPTYHPGRSYRSTGVQVWGRWWADLNWSVALETGLAIRPVLLDPEEEDFYRFERSLPLRLGAFWRGKGDGTHLEGGLHMTTVVGLNHRENLFGGGVSGSIYAPVWPNAALRVQVRTEVGRGWWSLNGFVGVEWGL